MYILTKTVEKQPGCKKVQGQSEARLQVTKAPDIEEGQKDKPFHYLFLLQK